MKPNQHLEVNVEDRVLSSRRTIRTVILDEYRGFSKTDSRRVYFDIESDAPYEAPPDLDAAILVTLFEAMRKKLSVVVNGPVSTGLLENLEEFQLVFSSWLPAKYSPVGIIARDAAPSQTADSRGSAAVAAFSGGVDACFTVRRHVKKVPGAYHKDMKTAVLVHGWDIPLGSDSAFLLALEQCRKMLAATGLGITQIRTNSRELLRDWEMNFGAGLGAVLSLFSVRHSCGLIGSDEPYGNLALPWGSNPISNPLMSSDGFKIITDGAGYTRTQKVAHLLDWEEACQHLRVCWEGPKTGLNCCKCEKCIRTILNFRALGAPRPAAFPTDVDDRQIREMRKLNPVQISYMEDIAAAARRSGVTASWVDEVDKLISRDKQPDRRMGILQHFRTMLPW